MIIHNRLESINQNQRQQIKTYYHLQQYDQVFLKCYFNPYPLF